MNATSPAATTTLRKRLVSPFQAISTVSIESIEQISKLQLSSAKIYTDIGLKQMRKLTGIRNMKQASEFTWSQLEPLGEIHKQVLSDWKDLTKINTSLKEELSLALKKTDPDLVPGKKPRKKSTVRKKPAAKKPLS